MTSSTRCPGSQLHLLLLLLLCSLTVSSSSSSTDDGSDPASALLDFIQTRPWTGPGPGPGRGLLLETGQEEALLRAERGELLALPLSPFPGFQPLESSFYQDGGDGDGGGRRSEALTSIIGGLQAVNREKGGFGFRFGRKRWTEQGWREEQRSSREEERLRLKV
uniref:Uncharacterized protein n=1 Tax=Cynoglossus semilaevis TaxID=244447 RepID=A0A3P8WT78_CYNSE